MKRLALVTLLLALLACCGASAQAQADVCASMDCGPYAASLHWDIAPWGHTTTGYLVFLAGTQEADVKASPWALGGMDCGSAYSLGVEAHDGSGDVSPMYTSVYATPTCGGGSSAPSFSPPSCTSTVTTSTWVSAVTAASSPAVLCLSAGTYSANTFSALDKAATGGGVVVEPVANATVSLGQITLDGGTNLTFEGFSSLNGSSSSGGLSWDGTTGGGTVSNLTWEFNSMATLGTISPAGDPVANANVLITNNKFVGFASSGEEDRIELRWNNSGDCTASQPSGYAVSYNLIANGESDGTDVDGNVCDAVIAHNVYQNIVEGNCGGIHCDPIQDDGGDRDVGTQITGNYFNGPDSTGYILQDSAGAGPDVITNNVFAGGSGASCQEGVYNDGTVEDHNTWDCSSTQGVDFFADSGTPSTNIEMKNDVFRSDGFVQWNGTGSHSYKSGSPDFNLYTSGAYGGTASTGAHDIIGSPTFSGGASPSTWAGYQLTGPSAALTGSSTGGSLGADITQVPGPSW